MTEFFPPARDIGDLLRRLEQRTEARRRGAGPADFQSPGVAQDLNDLPLNKSRNFRESVVSATERIARSIAHRTGHAISDSVPFHRLTDTRSRKIWKQACTATRLILDVDVEDMIFRLQIDDAAARRQGMRNLAVALNSGLCDEPASHVSVETEDA